MPADGNASRIISFTKALWEDPFRWQLVKSIALFCGAVFVVREIAAAEANPVTP